MGWYSVVQVLLALGVLVLIGFVIAVLIQLYRALLGLNELLGRLNVELVPFLKKLNAAVDGVNSELTRVDEIVASFQNVTQRVQSTSNFVQRYVAGPAVKAATVVSGAKVLLTNLVAKRKA